MIRFLLALLLGLSAAASAAPQPAKALFASDAVLGYRDIDLFSQPRDESSPPVRLNGPLAPGGFGLEYPIAFDASADIFDLYRVYALPTQFFIGGDGRIIEVVNGPLSEAKARTRIERWLPTEVASDPGPS